MLGYCLECFKWEVPSVCIFQAKFTAHSDLSSQKIILIGVVFMSKEANKWDWFCGCFFPFFHPFLWKSREWVESAYARWFHFHLIWKAERIHQLSSRTRLFRWSTPSSQTLDSVTSKIQNALVEGPYHGATWLQCTWPQLVPAQPCLPSLTRTCRSCLVQASVLFLRSTQNLTGMGEQGSRTAVGISSFSF